MRRWIDFVLLAALVATSYGMWTLGKTVNLQYQQIVQYDAAMQEAAAIVNMLQQSCVVPGPRA